MSNEPCVPLVLALDDASATLEQVGGKGASLARLASAGLPVPPGFHITTAAYRLFVTEHGLQEQILASVSAVTADQPATLEEASRRIAKLFAKSEMPDAIAEAIRQAYAELGGEDLPVAVRSSATAEDLPEMSFAGQQETYLNMYGEAMVLDAVKRCWASLWTARAIGYRARNNIAPQDVSLAVVVQQLVFADASGILFTANPLTGNRNQVMINAAEDLYGQPMDIEWVLHDGRVSVVQARPITSLPEPTIRSQGTRAVEWKLPNPKGRYMRKSVFELLPDPLSPLFATLGLPALDRATWAIIKIAGLEGLFSGKLLVTINEYGYYDLTFTPGQTAKMILALPRIIAVTLPRLLRSAQSRWQKSRARYAEVVNRWQTTDLATTSAEDLLNGVRDIATEAAQYYLSIQTGILPAAYMSELFFTLVYNRFLKRRNAPTALTFVLGFDSTPIQTEKSLYDLAQWVREQPELAAALANMSSKQFTTAYHEWAARAAIAEGVWPEFWRRLADHLARFGHTIYDLDFAKAVLADDPAPALETLKFFLSDQAPDPYKRQEKTSVAREQAVQTMLSQLHGRRQALFQRLVRWAQSFTPLREDALADVGLGWPVLRRMLHEIGQRLVTSNVIDTPDDVFWLTQDELQKATTALDAGQAPANYHALVAERRATWESDRAVTPPVALPLKGGARFLGINFSNTMPARIDQPKGDVLKGIATSPGHVTGPARVIHGPDEFDQMRPGDILVARITTPAWTPLFTLAAGVVTDVGGPLSHSSIVAREYHIPAVLGTGVATEYLSSGQRIAVDGDAGTVTVSS